MQYATNLVRSLQPHSCSMGAGLECTIHGDRQSGQWMSIAAAQDRPSVEVPCQHMHKLAGLLLEPPGMSSVAVSTHTTHTLARVPYPYPYLYPATTWPAPPNCASIVLYTLTTTLHMYVHISIYMCPSTYTATYLVTYVRIYALKQALGILLLGTLHNALSYAFIIHSSSP